MTKRELRQYRALKTEIADLDKRIKTIQDTSHCEVMDKVKGSSPVYPFIHRSFTITGEGESDEQHLAKLKLKDTMGKKKLELSKALHDIETYIQSLADSETRMIYRYYYIDGYSQQAIALKLHLSQGEVSKRLKEYSSEKVS